MRPAVIVQADWITPEVDSVILTLLTSDTTGADLLRQTVLPSAANGLKELSQIMIEKTGMVSQKRIRTIVGRLDASDMEELSRRLAVVMGLTNA